MFIASNKVEAAAAADAEAEADEARDSADAKPTAATKKPPRSKPDTDDTTEKLPPWAVVLHNDDINGMDFVVESLLNVFTMNVQQAEALTMQAHTAGRSIVWTGHRELAELKASQLTGRGGDPMMMHRGAKPLRVSVEKMPG